MIKIDKVKLFIYFYFNKIGAIAQLGERLNGIQEVSGSIPLSSTDNPLILKN
jgi:hypothetical protein